MTARNPLEPLAGADTSTEGSDIRPPGPADAARPMRPVAAGLGTGARVGSGRDLRADRRGQRPVRCRAAVLVTGLVAAMIGRPDPSWAQQVDFDPAPTASCLAAASDTRQAEAPKAVDCAGMAAETCMSATPGGYSTAGMIGCLSQELDWWDAELNRAYGAAMKMARAEDADLGGASGGAVPQATALRSMQRAWIPYRDARCVFERSRWGGGTGGGPAEVSCLLYVTARQALYLRSLVEEVQ